MPDYRIYSLAKGVRAMTSAARSANTTVAGDTIDRTDNAAGVMFVILTGTLTDGTHTFTVQDSDDGSSWGNAAAGDILGTAATTAADDDSIKELGYRGNKRYVRLSVTTAGATTGGVFGAIAVTTGGRKPVLR